MRKTLVLLLAGLSLAAAAQAGVKINALSVTPRILVEFYRANQAGGNTLVLPSQIVMMSLTSTQAALAFKFHVEVYDGGTWVVRTSNASFWTGPVQPGVNLFDLSQITVHNLNLQFNSDYNPSNDLSKLTSGGLPMGNYRIVVVPDDPSGTPYSASVALFTPSSALNQPPLLIYPKDIEVNVSLPTFSWTPVSHASSYEVLVGPDIDPTVNTYWKSGLLSGTQVLYAPGARALENGKKYAWLVVAYNEFGQPIGGTQGRSQPAWFKLNTPSRAASQVSVREVEAVLKQVAPNQFDWDRLKDYEPLAVESTATDLPALVEQLRQGGARVISGRVE